MTDPRLNAVERFYDFHPINAKQIVDAVVARGIAPDAITEAVLQQHDQDHYGGTAATDRLITEAAVRAEDVVLDVDRQVAPVQDVREHQPATRLQHPRARGKQSWLVRDMSKGLLRNGKRERCVMERHVQRIAVRLQWHGWPGTLPRLEDWLRRHRPGPDGQPSGGCHRTHARCGAVRLRSLRPTNPGPARA